MLKCEPTPRKSTFTDFVDAAKRAGYSTRHFRRLADEGQIRFIRIGRKFWVRTSDLDEWIAARRAKAVDDEV